MKAITKLMMFILVVGLISCKSDDETLVLPPEEEIILDLLAPTIENPTLTNWSYDGVTLTWPQATDDIDLSTDLEYRVVQSMDPTLIDTAAEVAAITGGDLILDWTLDATTANLIGLALNTTYHYVVAVRDQAGNIAITTPLEDSLRSGLILNLPFSGNEFDATGNVGPLDTTSNALVYVNDRHGQATSAAEFDGVTSSIVFNGAVVPSPISYSFSLWFQPYFPGALTYSFLISKGFNLYEVQLASPNPATSWDSVRFLPTTVATIPHPIDNAYLFDGSWHHLVVTYEDVNAQVFINGILVDTRNDITPPDSPANALDLHIGNRIDNGAFFFGSIDDLMMYDRPLTQAEVQALFLQ